MNFNFCALPLSIISTMSTQNRKKKVRDVFTYAKFDLNALLRRAEQLRNIPCSYDPSIPPKDGSHNWVIFLMFEDGVEWVFRSPRQSHDTCILPESTAKLLESEVATMKYIRLNSSIPVPEVYDHRYIIEASIY